MPAYFLNAGVLALASALAMLRVVWGDAPHAAPAAAEREVSVLADTVSKSALRDAIAAFERMHPGVVVRPRFAGTYVVAEQLRLGAQPDAVVLGSSEARAMRDMLADETAAFSDHTAIVVSVAARERIRDAADLARPGVRLGAGRAGTALADLGDATVAKLASLQPPGYRERLAANVAEEEHDSQRGALVDAIAAGAVDAAIALGSDAVPGKSVEVALPDAVRITRTETAAVVRGTPHPELARAFVKMLGSREGAALFGAHGHDPSAAFVN